MSTEISRIQKTFKHSWTGPMWHGANLKEILDCIDYQKAFRKPAAGSHNIYELVAHMLCWRKFVLEHFKGNTSYKVELNSELDWPTQYETTEANWKNTIAAFEQNQIELENALSNATDSQLQEIVPGKEFNWYIFIHGLIHHDIYHSAQIAILKK